MDDRNGGVECKSLNDYNANVMNICKGGNIVLATRYTHKQTGAKLFGGAITPVEPCPSSASCAEEPDGSAVCSGQPSPAPEADPRPHVIVHWNFGHDPHAQVPPPTNSNSRLLVNASPRPHIMPPP